MAHATRQDTIPVQATTKSFTLVLTPEETRALMRVLSAIGGDLSGQRRHIETIHDSLLDAGAAFEGLDSEIKVSGSLYLDN